MIELDLARAVEDRFPGTVMAWDDRTGQRTLTLSPAHLVGVCEFLRDEPEAGYDLLTALTFTHACLWYQLTHTGRGRRLQLCVPLSDRDPASAASIVDSLASIWLAANWAEREVHDLHGVVFRGHPDLRPILTTDVPCPEARSQTPDPRSPHTWSLPTGMRYPTSMDGLFLHLELDGEQVSEVRPSFGSCHVGLDRALAQRPYEQGTWVAARIDGFASMHADLAYALAVEKLLQVEPPRRAQQLRLVYAELQRVASHLFWLARTAQTESDPTSLASAYAWEARETILNWFQSLGGNPITPDRVAVGGLEEDMSSALVSALHDLLDDLETQLGDLHCLLGENQAFLSRLDGIGLIDPGTALGLGLTGPCLRGSGVAYDVRQAFPYCGFDSLPVQISMQQEGDAGARFRVRMAELTASLGLIRQVLSQLSSGPVNAFDLSPRTGHSAFPPLPPGSVFAAVEGPRGELGVCLFSDGSGYPKHVYVRGPSFANLSALPLMAHGLSLAQLRTVLDSLDVSAAEAAR